MATEPYFASVVRILQGHKSAKWVRFKKKGLLKSYFAAFDSYFVSRSNIGSPQLHRLSVSNPLE